jgi:hypothetical protein
MAFSRIQIIKLFTNLVVILIFYSALIDARCRRFDEKALENVNFDKVYEF